MSFLWSLSQALALRRLSRPGSALLFSWTPVPTLSASLCHCLYLRWTHQVGKAPLQGFTFFCHWFPQSPSMVAGSSLDCRQTHIVAFGFLWLRIYDFSWRMCFRVILQNLNRKILTKGNLMKTQSSAFLFSFHIFWHFIFLFLLYFTLQYCIGFAYIDMNPPWEYTSSTFLYCASFPRTWLLVWFIIIIIQLILFCILPFSTCALTV